MISSGSSPRTISASPSTSGSPAKLPSPPAGKGAASCLDRAEQRGQIRRVAPLARFLRSDADAVWWARVVTTVVAWFQPRRSRASNALLVKSMVWPPSTNTWSVTAAPMNPGSCDAGPAESHGGEDPLGCVAVAGVDKPPVPGRKSRAGMAALRGDRANRGGRPRVSRDTKARP